MRSLLFLTVVTVLGAGCAAGLCERRARFFETRCSGTDVSFDGDPMCKARLEGCSKAELAPMEAYVACLEEAEQCSMAVVAECARAHPGGVNLACERR
ncbi:MAG TPA: hypothetical protein RMG48_02820 [Myxococcales bacterium LLY-WYZ-16_1]|jgi:hypothetical protein|nr:hypothetical protein [Myxococcales bacterium LLY-WYZ-16_1]